jgi:DNA-binding transcriptional ArsR family regulator
MLEVRFSVEDLTRVRLTSTLGMAFETHLAWRRLADQQRDAFGEWRRITHRRLRRLSGTRAVAEPSLSLMETLETSSPGEGEVFHRAAVEPFWDRILRSLKADRDARGRAMLSGGIEQVLGGLHSALHWQAPVLRIDNSQPDRQTDLAGRGITLVPSLFATQPFLIDSQLGWQGTPFLVYGITPDPEAMAVLWQRADDGSALADLLGRTRADVLNGLREPGSTGQLAARLRISSPSASKHIAVLRRAGFVTTERRANSAVHSLTPRGETLLD